MNSAARARGSGTGAPLQAIDQVLFGAPIASLVEVASAKVLERLAGAENVEDRNGDLVCDCTRGAPRSNASSHAAILLRQIAGLGASSGDGGGVQGGLE